MCLVDRPHCCKTGPLDHCAPELIGHPVISVSPFHIGCMWTVWIGTTSSRKAMQRKAEMHPKWLWRKERSQCVFMQPSLVMWFRISAVTPQNIPVNITWTGPKRSPRVGFYDLQISHTCTTPSSVSYFPTQCMHLIFFTPCIKSPVLVCISTPGLFLLCFILSFYVVL